MTTIFLPGFAGQYNGPEMTEVCNFLREKGLQVQEFHWPHWEDPNVEFVADNEVDKVWHYISTQADQEFNIVAKSIGTYVTMKLLLKQRDFMPNKVILMGVPVSGSLPEEEIRLFPEAMARLGASFHIIQNENDPFGSAAQVEKLFENTTHNLHTKEGNDTHAYQLYKEDVYAILSA